jgi:hypothetical protein
MSEKIGRCHDCTAPQTEVNMLSRHILELQDDKGKLIDYNKKLLQENAAQHNKIVLLSKKVNDLQKENAKVEEIKANADYQLEGRDLEIKELKAQIEKMKSHSNCKHRSEYNEFDPYSKVCQSCCNLEKWEFGEIKEK